MIRGYFGVRILPPTDNRKVEDCHFQTSASLDNPRQPKKEEKKWGPENVLFLFASNLRFDG